MCVCGGVWMKTIHYPNKIRSHLVIIASMAPFTSKSTSKLRFVLHSRYSKVIPRFIPRDDTLNPNNHSNNGFHNTFDYNHFSKVVNIINVHSDC